MFYNKLLLKKAISFIWNNIDSILILNKKQHILNTYYHVKEKDPVVTAFSLLVYKCD